VPQGEERGKALIEAPARGGIGRENRNKKREVSTKKSDREESAQPSGNGNPLMICKACKTLQKRPKGGEERALKVISELGMASVRHARLSPQFQTLSAKEPPEKNLKQGGEIRK